MNFTRGQKSKLSDLTSSEELIVGVGVEAPGSPVFDVSCFGVDENGKLSDDRYFVFYNQKQSPEGEIQALGVQGGDREAFRVNLAHLPQKIHKLVFTVTLDGAGTMSQVSRGHLRITAGGSEVARFPFSGGDFAQEKAVVVGEVYRKGVWRFAAVGQGFDGGLSALLKHFGGEEIEDSAPPPLPVPSEPPKAASSSREERTEVKLRKEAPQLVELSKKLSVSLKKSDLEEVVARVALVLDASGSMTGQYDSGSVQAVVDRIATLAMRFDDDGELEVWAFASRHAKLPSITTQNVIGFVDRARKGSGFLSIIGKLGVGNNEPPVMREVMSHSIDTESPAGQATPTFVVFVSDGGISLGREIEKILTEASKHSIFWQFVGLGGSNYGVLERLDAMGGRAVDNAGFFHVDDLREVSDSTLYDRLLSEFPKWLREARSAGILR